MSIVVKEEERLFALHTAHTTYQMQVNPLGQLLHLYYGERLEGAYATQLVGEAAGIFCPEPGDMGMDCGCSANILLQEFSCAGTGDFRSACLRPVFADGSRGTELRYVSYRIIPGKHPLPGLPALYFAQGECDTLEIILADRVTGLQVVLQYAVAEEQDAIARSARIENKGDHPIVLEAALSCCLDFYGSAYHLIRFLGRPLMERQMVRTPLTQGETSLQSCSGISSHQANPFVILCAPDASETDGACYGVSLVYSGSFLAEAQVDMFGQTRLTMGINPTDFRWRLAGGESFQTPETVLVYSERGLGELSRRYHRLYREHLCRGRYREERRPVLINSWEALLYDFDAAKLLALARDAAELGIEMLVIDDGWFGRRNDDQSSLGDWTVNEQKLGGTLAGLAASLHRQGMKLGLWIEPEMVSENSELYRAHPDWCLRIPGREPARGRYQLVLDMSRDDVVEYLTATLSTLLADNDIDYVKWDMNRPLTDVWSANLPAEQQGEVMHRYVLGVYRLLERLVVAFPDVLFESCSSGGGRFDPGMLYYTPQIWCSDNSDAASRLLIQYNTSFGYPVSAMGSHISPCPNHQVGRTTPLKTRGVVAMAGTFGFELNLCGMTEEDKRLMKAQTAFYKAHYALINRGDYYRLTNPYEDTPVAWQFVSRDRTQALVGFVQRLARPNPRPFILKLQGLIPEALYRVTVDGQEQSELFIGGLLMQAGFALPQPKKDYDGYYIELVQVS